VRVAPSPELSLVLETAATVPRIATGNSYRVRDAEGLQSCLYMSFLPCPPPLGEDGRKNYVRIFRMYDRPNSQGHGGIGA